MQSILAVFDLDGTLLNSPLPPEGKPNWWYDPRSLDGIEAPGFDPRWNIPLILEARRLALRNDENMVVLCTGRPDTLGMRTKIGRLLDMADINFQLVQLKPLNFGGHTSEYKAYSILSWAQEMDKLRKVKFWDDDEANHRDVALLLAEEGIPLDAYKIG